MFQIADEPLSSSIVTIDYQVDDNADFQPDDAITLLHKDSGWSQTLMVHGRERFDRDWVRLTFENVPQTGVFDLIHTNRRRHQSLYDVELFL
ncbi:hypothetical protein [uncultured Cohaesibacter sp.]|uniref:hypothetical protein n=1 Tax=uncultured Cohaesibacter sp. TaxID=1002546 RepID=UPI002930B4AA|nr:hypothetical protein [uncultured Cohaesibacter sp.]